MFGVARGRLGSYTLALALGLSALGAGAVHLPVLVPYAVLVVASGLLSCRPGVGREWVRGFQTRQIGEEAFVSGARHRVTVATAAWMVLAVVCWAQVVPVPMGWLEALAPMSADIWARALRPFGAPEPSWASISLAPGRTLIEALKFASYAVVFGVSARLSARSGVRGIAWIIFGCGLLVALATAAHQVFALERLYGVYRPITANIVAPILNNNSLGGYLNLAAFCGLGLLFRRDEKVPLPLIAVGLVLIVAEVIICQSRGATLCLVLGLLMLLFLPRGSAEPSGRVPSALGWWQASVMGLIGIAASLMAVLATRRQGWGRLADDSLEKLNLFAWSSELARAAPLVGIGRGSFGSVFFAYQQDGKNSSYDHAENIVLQWSAEWGVLVAGLAMLALGWGLLPLLSRRSLGSPTRRCMLVGCGVLLLQNLADLGLEIPAVAALLACALGGLAGALLHGARTTESSSVPLAPGSRVILAGSGLTGLALILAVSLGSDTLPRLRHELHARLSASRGASPDAFWSELRAAVLAFPGDPYFPLLGSSAALAAGKNAVPWVSRALERSPRHGQAHFQLARILGARGATDQALGALRRAMELDEQQTRPALELGLAWGLTPQRLRDAVPDGRAGAPMLRALAAHVDDVPSKILWLDEAVERDPSNADAHYALAVELLRDLQRKDQAVACRQRETCLTSAHLHAEKGDRQGHPRAAILLAQLLVERGDGRAAEEQLWRACEAFPANDRCDSALVTLALTNSSARLSEAVKRMVASGCSSSESCGRTHLTLGDLFLDAGRPNTALTHYEHATREDPSARSWRALARASRDLGRAAVAEEALRRVRLLESGGDTLPKEDARAPAEIKHPAPPEEPPPLPRRD